MFESLLQDMDELFKGKAFLTVEDISQFLNCSPVVVYNWSKRANAKRRPPRIQVGKELRFPKKEFVKWLATEQASG